MKIKTAIVATEKELEIMKELGKFCNSQIDCTLCPFESICSDCVSIEHYMNRILEKIQIESEE